MNTAPDEASAALAQIRDHQERVIRAAIIPNWYWWAIGIGMVAIGAAADTRKPVVLGVVIPIVALGMVALTIAMILGIGRGARIKSNELLGGRGALLIVASDWLIVGLTIGTAFALRALRVPEPATIATAVGALVLVIIGPVLSRKLNKIMMDNRAGLPT
jgi:hypothetical protein